MQARLKVNNLEKIIGYSFKDKDLLSTALTHSSFANENKTQSYERLEFLGDSLLEYIVSDYIYKNFPNEREGSLTQIRAKLVQEKTLADLVQSMEINKFIKIGKSLRNEIKQSILCDIYESLLGAIYLDSNLQTAYDFVLTTLVKNKENVALFENVIMDYKSQLQELCQSKNLKIEYKSRQVDGEFEVKLFINDVLKNVSRAKSIKQAEQSCAKNIYIEMSKK